MRQPTTIHTFYSPLNERDVYIETLSNIVLRNEHLAIKLERGVGSNPAV